VAALLSRKRAQGAANRAWRGGPGVLRPAGGRNVRHARDAQARIKKRTHQQLTESVVRSFCAGVGGKLKCRASRTRKKIQQSQGVQSGTAARLSAVVGATPRSPSASGCSMSTLRPVASDSRVWGRRGVRVHAPYTNPYKWGYLHEALEVVARMPANCCSLSPRSGHPRPISAPDRRVRLPTALHWSFADRPVSIARSDARIPAHLRLLPLPPIVPNSIRSNTSAVCSKRPSPTG